MTSADEPQSFVGLSVAIDAVNVSLARGTGLATYARGLANALLSGGATVDFLLDRPHGDDPALLDVAAFDAQIDAAAAARASAGRWMRRLKLALALASNAGSVAAHKGSASDLVLRRSYADRMPAGVGLLLADGLLDLSEVMFRRTGQFINVRTPPPSPRVFHWTSPFPARASGGANIYTIHDLAPLRLPDATLDPKTSFHDLLRKISRTADHILTVSENAKSEIIAYLGAPPELVSVVYPVVEADQSVLAESDSERRAFLRDGYGLTWKKYFLFFGSIEPKKNLARLIEAYAGAETSSEMVIVSAQAWLSERDLHLLAPYADGQETPLARKVRRIDYLPRRDLERLIRGARAVMMASSYEGFGLPIAEGALYGTPALAGKDGATAETAGDGALLVDPFDVRDIRAGLSRLDADDGFAAALGVRAEKNSGRFSRSRQSAALAALYARLGVR